MASIARVDLTYINLASSVSELSYAKRLKVGAVIANMGVVVSTGFNGTPRGTENVCEVNDTTKKDVIHAELNAILNLVISGSSASLYGSTIYITHSPCIHCAAIIKQVGISRVVYHEDYRLPDGIDYLREYGIEVFKL